MSTLTFVDIHNMVAFLEKPAESDGFWKRISEKRTKNQAKPDKTEHGMEKREKTKSSRSPSQQKTKSKSNPEKSTVKTGAGIEEYLMGPPEPI
ncbi:hypothetical protein Tco_0062906 [Tanacetum coccineum]